RAAAGARARQRVGGLGAGQDPRARARQDGITAGETSAFSGGEPLPDRDLAAAIGTIALELPEGGVGGPAGGGRGFYAVKVVAREHPGPAEFEKARPELEKQLLEQKRTPAPQAAPA